MPQYLPPNSDTSELGLLAILSTIADPDATKTRLKDLTVLNNQLKDTIAQSKVESQKVDDLKKQNSDILQEINTKRSDYEAFVKSTTDALDKRSKDLDARETEINQKNLEASNKLDTSTKLQQDLTKRISDVSSREVKATEWESRLINLETSLNEKLSKHEAKVTKLKELINA